MPVKRPGWLTMLAASLLAGQAATGEPAPPEGTEHPWAFALSSSLYLEPYDGDYLQPTFRADRGPLHLEARWNYEDLESGSLFAGATLAAGETVELAVTPMLGGVVGRTDGIVPALEADLAAGMFAAWLEAEYVFDLAAASSGFGYAWMEVSLRPVNGFRVGVVHQGTWERGADGEILRGFLAGLGSARLEATFYWLEPARENRLAVVSFGVLF